MKLAIGSDHAGYDLKEQVKSHLEKAGHQCVDCGTGSTDSVDYPDFAGDVARKVSSGQCELGILVCGTGIGMSIAANKVRGIRAAHVGDVVSARLAREHNDANIITMGARIVGADVALAMVDAWLEASFAGGRHSRRVDKMMQLEKEMC